MADPLPQPAFEALLARSGLTAIGQAEREDIRGATRLLAAYAARVRAPMPEPALEPAVVFAAPEPGP
jgi:hypothetical protein